MRLSSAFLYFCGSICLSLHVAAFAYGPHTRNSKLGLRKNTRSSQFTTQDSRTNGLPTVLDTDDLLEYNFSQPLDHFSEDSPYFNQRYWVNMRHYVPGSNGPVILIDGGEVNCTTLLPILDTGIADILTSAVGGVGVLLEHRYYGESIPVENFTTDSLRWLTVEQALQDSARFIANVKFEGIDEDLTAPNTPWIYYGGSYAGARAAFMRTQFPDLVYGAIGSSAVVRASIELWQYYDVIRQYANQTCVGHLENLAVTIDAMLEDAETNNAVKTLFGLEALSDYYFVHTIEEPLDYWQDRNWDPAVGSTVFHEFCGNISLTYDTLEEAVEATGVDMDVVMELADFSGFDSPLLNYAAYVKENIVKNCTDAEECFGYPDSYYEQTDLSQTWRPWQFQVCTQWGHFFTAPPVECLPRIVSRLRTVETESIPCRKAFAAGEYFTVPELPDIGSLNALGGFNIAKDRLALIDGEADPWRPMTPHSQYFPSNRSDTTSRPFKIIPEGVHHWDENGLADHAEEPLDIQAIHLGEVEFVKAWLEEFGLKS